MEMDSVLSSAPHGKNFGIYFGEGVCCIFPNGILLLYFPFFQSYMLQYNLRLANMYARF